MWRITILDRADAPTGAELYDALRCLPPPDCGRIRRAFDTLRLALRWDDPDPEADLAVLAEMEPRVMRRLLDQRPGRVTGGTSL